MAVDTQVAATATDRSSSVSWGAVIAGAIGASALAFVLHSFAAALGLSLSSTAPTWRDTSFALVFLAGLYLILMAMASYSFGAYIAARVQAPLAGVSSDTEFRDGMHGLLVWGLATLITGVLAIAAAQATQRLAAPSASTSSTSVAGENIIAYDLDRLFRSERRPPGNMDYARAEAARILLTAPSHRGMQGDDRAYLVRLTAAMTGLAPPDAERRVGEVIASAQENLNRARRSGIVLGFMAGAAALIGAACAWYAACAAGRHRDGREALNPLWDWSRPAIRS